MVYLIIGMTIGIGILLILLTYAQIQEQKKWDSISVSHIPTKWGKLFKVSTVLAIILTIVLGVLQAYKVFDDDNKEKNRDADAHKTKIETDDKLAKMQAAIDACNEQSKKNSIQVAGITTVVKTEVEAVKKPANPVLMLDNEFSPTPAIIKEKNSEHIEVRLRYKNNLIGKNGKARILFLVKEPGANNYFRQIFDWIELNEKSANVGISATTGSFAYYKIISQLTATIPDSAYLIIEGKFYNNYGNIQPQFRRIFSMNNASPQGALHQITDRNYSKIENFLVASGISDK